jgi:hypothetical protein
MDIRYQGLHRECRLTAKDAKDARLSTPQRDFGIVVTFEFIAGELFYPNLGKCRNGPGDHMHHLSGSMTAQTNLIVGFFLDSCMTRS